MVALRGSGSRVASRFTIERFPVSSKAAVGVSRNRASTGSSFRGEPGVSGRRKAARQLRSAWRDSACASPGRCSRVAGRGETPQYVANQESQARPKQRDGCGQRRVIRLAHLPGDAAVPPGAARLLSAWRTSSQMSDRCSCAASDVDLARFDLRIIRALQSPGRPRHDG